jgi:hypothetical protein
LVRGAGGIWDSDGAGGGAAGGRFGAGTGTRGGGRGAWGVGSGKVSVIDFADVDFRLIKPGQKAVTLLKKSNQKAFNSPKHRRANPERNQKFFGYLFSKK